MEDITIKKIFDYSLEEIMGDRFGTYSKYIIQDRAIPDVRDGLKPVQRRVLYAMYMDHNTHDKKFKKCANAVGIILGKYHPHGDSSVYEALVRLSQQKKVLSPILVIPSDIVISVNAVQSENTPFSRDFTLLGISASARDLQDANAYSPNIVSDEGRLTAVNPVFLNASDPIVSRVSSNPLILVNAVQFSNAQLSIPSTFDNVISSNEV